MEETMESENKSLLATFLRAEQNWSLGHALSHYAIRIGLEQIAEEADICSRESMESSDILFSSAIHV